MKKSTLFWISMILLIKLNHSLSAQTNQTLSKITLDENGSVQIQNSINSLPTLFDAENDFTPEIVSIRPSTIEKTSDISVDPSSWDYGSIVVGSHADKVFVIRNEGILNLNITSMTKSGAVADYVAISGCCTATLAPGAVHQVVIRFTPSSSGIKTATINIYSTDPIENPYIIHISGEGVLSRPDLTITEIHVIDGNGPDISYKLTVRNQGALVTSSEFKNRFYLSADNTITNDDYLINDWNVSDHLAPGESKTSWDLTSTVIDVPAGEYYLGAITDAKNEIIELNENNNTRTAASHNVIIPEKHVEPEACEGNMISNWSFTNGMNDWQFTVMGSGNAVYSIEDDVVHIQITGGGENPWDVSLMQYDFMIINGNTYTATFQAKAASPRDLSALVGMAANPFTVYNSDNTYSLTSEWQTFTSTFTMNYPTDPGARVGFDIGISDVDVYLDNICLVETASSTDMKPNEPSQIVRTFNLFQNHPNPFNPSTTIRYTVPKSCHVTLTIYDLLGKEIIALVSESRSPGEYSVSWNSEGHAAGIYLYRLKTAEFIETRKLILQK
ncbi:choice-of-anchor D domain-containing protein [bacterium]